VGLILSTPLTTVLVVLGKYVPQLAFLDILLGDEPVLDPPQRVYQRLLALDQEEAIELLREYKRDSSLEAVYDNVLLPAIAMAEQDAHRGELDDQRRDFIQHATREIVEELADDEHAAAIRDAAEVTERAAKNDYASRPLTSGTQARDAGNGEEKPVPRLMLPKDRTIRVVLLPARDEANELVNLMLAQLLELRGYEPVSFSVSALASEMLHEIEQHGADVVVVSALPPAGVSHARYLCKRISARFPDRSLLVGLWTYKGDLERARERLACQSSICVATTLAETLEQLHHEVQPLLAGESQQSEPATAGSQNRKKAPGKKA